MTAKLDHLTHPKHHPQKSPAPRHILKSRNSHVLLGRPQTRRAQQHCGHHAHLRHTQQHGCSKLLPLHCLSQARNNLGTAAARQAAAQPTGKIGRIVQTCVASPIDPNICAVLPSYWLLHSQYDTQYWLRGSDDPAAAATLGWVQKPRHCSRPPSHAS